MAQLTHRYTGSYAVRGHITTVLERFEEFAEFELGKWQLKGGTDGRQTFFALLYRTFTIGVDLEPSSIWTYFEDNLRRSRHVKQKGWFEPYIREKPVRYDYKIKFEFFASNSLETVVSFETIEEIDPDNNVPRQLGREFRVPQMPEGKGQIGEKFLELLRITGV